MGKLGKKARKFSKKNLQSVLKRKRQLKSLFKRRASKRDRHNAAEDEDEVDIELSNGRNPEAGDIEDISLDAVFSEDDSDVTGDDSESDGYLSEDSSCAHVAESGSEDYLKDSSGGSALSVQNNKIHLDLVQKKKKLNRLQEKDPEFAKFLESYDKGQPFRNEETYSDEDEISNEGMASNEGKFLTSSAVKSWCQLVKEQHSVPALTSLLNGYRAACHYGTKSSGVLDAESWSRIQNSETFCEILMFVLHEADNIFRGLLEISSSNCKKEAILGLKNTSKWKTLRPLIKSYLRSTLFLLSQVTDYEILAFALARLRNSILYFAAFPSLLRRLIKIAVHLWATGGGALSSHSFLIIKDVASVFSSNCFDTCFVKTYKAFIGHCQFLESAVFKHMQFLRNSLVELCSLDMQKSSRKAMVSIKQLAKTLQQGLQMKKEALKKICSWQYVNCIDIWVTFIAANIRDYDLQPLLFMIIQIINGVAVLFSGPRYLPLRLKCIQWLNHLSSSSGIFIPVASLVLDVLEYNISKEGRSNEKAVNLSSAVKLPKHWLKSRNFQEECVSSVIELLAEHFAQWSYHISFPELATIPLVRLKKFIEITSIESFRRVVKRFIDQVEHNIEFVQKKRDEVAFSPKDLQSVESFLQLEKHSGKFPFTQYYRSIMEKAASRNLVLNEKFAGAEKIIKNIQQHPSDMVDVGGKGKGHSVKRKTLSRERKNGKKIKV
ncbi:nucleolar complex protein 2 homolog [Quercus lobata]|uniref:Nucleolar complex protein 2 homolog n=1 Tax=Quercus lobata TaxID=97700 RepID=A0A7N2MF50_QUELO|nr:nucleolar complex protein 2 homolog [Quercus lobata]XP_030930155.1 nucleolar complex protein 2 homolog [Quercus lobata]